MNNESTPKPSQRARKIVADAYELRSTGDLEFVLEGIGKLLDVRKLIEPDAENDVDEELKESRLVQRLLDDSGIHLKGPDAALLGCLYLRLDAELEEFTARQVNRILRKHKREVANITTTMKLLVQRGDCESEGEAGSHRSYALTNRGFMTARDVIATHM